ncbi:hypothetical protein LTR36_010036 [Oleoguttula mirabilis]|uniref:Uncharacterized protein n=1 Tax=Oleoguttula mirabilis TaxID=1507867 RepID=A0AAV9JT29_9PEZI|nr:hypothetical protein LTR36_010036 [Oleoguttula mirabilis]
MQREAAPPQQDPTSGKPTEKTLDEAKRVFVVMHEYPSTSTTLTERVSVIAAICAHKSNAIGHMQRIRDRVTSPQTEQQDQMLPRYRRLWTLSGTAKRRPVCQNGSRSTHANGEEHVFWIEEHVLRALGWSE